MGTEICSVIKATFVGVQFTRAGWKQLCRLNRTLGIRFICAFVLKHELAVYLSEHEANGIHMDTVCQEVRYDDGIYLLLRKTQGVWYITDIIIADAPDTFLPVYSVRNILRGFKFIIMLVFTGWRHQSGRREQRVVIV